MKNLKLLIFVAVGVGFASCNPKFYSPNTQNVPLISEMGETNLTLSGNTNQVEFQGAYGVTQNIAIKANGGLFIPKNLSNGNGGSGKFIEVGGGYFKPITENWIFETYGIIGLGTVENHFPSSKAGNPGTNGDVSANIFRIGVQPNFGYKSRYFSAAVSSRIVNLSYNTIKGDLIFADKNQVQYLKDNSSNILVEPALTIKGGLEKVKLQVQYGYSLNLSNSDFTQDKQFVTIGLNFTFK